MLQREDVTFIPGTPVAVRAYSIKDYWPHWHSDCLEVIAALKGDALVLASYDRFHLNHIQEQSMDELQKLRNQFIMEAVKFLRGKRC